MEVIRLLDTMNADSNLTHYISFRGPITSNIFRCNKIPYLLSKFIDSIITKYYIPFNQFITFIKTIQARCSFDDLPSAVLFL